MPTSWARCFISFICIHSKKYLKYNPGGKNCWCIHVWLFCNFKVKNKTKKTTKNLKSWFTELRPIPKLLHVGEWVNHVGLGLIISHPLQGPIAHKEAKWCLGKWDSDREKEGQTLLPSLVIYIFITQVILVWGSYISPLFSMHKEHQSPCLINSFLKHFIFITFSIIIAIISVQGCIISGLDDWVSLPTCLISSMPLLWFPAFGQKKKKFSVILIILLYSQTSEKLSSFSSSFAISPLGAL